MGMVGSAGPYVVRTLPGALDVISGPSDVCTVPSASDVGLGALYGASAVAMGPFQVHTLPGASDVGVVTPTPPLECWAAVWRGDWSCCCRRIPQSAPECLFFF